MKLLTRIPWQRFLLALNLFSLMVPAALALGGNIYDPGQLKARDSELKVKVGDPAPDFELPAVSGKSIRLSGFQNQRNVVLSFVPAAWTPVCSDQWPGYNIARELFEARDAILLGITTDNIPTLFAWTREMGELWFPVLSDFWPHGEAAASYGVLRSDGTAERALIYIDKAGVITHIHVEDINVRPKLEDVVAALDTFKPSP